MAHTPSPWHAVDRKDDRGNNSGISIWAEDGEDQYGTPRAVQVCALPDGASLSGGHCFPEQLANARLIAAAPDLMEALKDARRRLTDTANEADSCWRDWPGSYGIDAAIAKAEGTE